MATKDMSQDLTKIKKKPAGFKTEKPFFGNKTVTNTPVSLFDLPSGETISDELVDQTQTEETELQQAEATIEMFRAQLKSMKITIRWHEKLVHRLSARVHEKDYKIEKLEAQVTALKEQVHKQSSLI